MAFTSRSVLSAIFTLTIGLVVSRAAEPAKYVIGAPDILTIDASGLPKKFKAVGGQHLVRPDGTVGLGQYGAVDVSSRTVEQASDAIAKHLAKYAKKKAKLRVQVEVATFNSSVFYLIVSDKDGDRVDRLPQTGNETVLDAVIRRKRQEPLGANPRVWVQRGEKVLPVDWAEIVRDGHTATNYQIRPDDRIHVVPAPAK